MTMIPCSAAAAAAAAAWVCGLVLQHADLPGHALGAALIGTALALGLENIPGGHLGHEGGSAAWLEPEAALAAACGIGAVLGDALAEAENESALAGPAPGTALPAGPAPGAMTLTCPGWPADWIPLSGRSQLRSVHEADPAAVSPLLPSQLMGLVGHSAPAQGHCADCPGRFELCMIACVMVGMAVRRHIAVSGAGCVEGGCVVGMLGGVGGDPSCPEMQ